MTKPTYFHWSCRLSRFCVTIILVGCATSAPKLPYPAFIQADELPDIFMASLPGVRAKQFAGDAQSRSTSNRIDLPADWSGTSGASPGKALELFVLDGELRLSDVVLGRGGYAYLPSGTLGFSLRTESGARILYFLNDVDPRAFIRTPLLQDSRLLDWTPTGDGTEIKELRVDPGSGARTWLLKIRPGVPLPWQSSSVLREGYLAAGYVKDSECVNGEVHTGEYLPGGYFYRPANTPHGGPDAAALAESVWLLREKSAGTARTHDACVDAALPDDL